ncbi:alpha-amylase family glycosyl hydrolase [Symbiobacterium terraclitae]|uniref:alpha-amylase family glycosyl hydrolase n=1 Tax=Symbiobacterium terraclitae TaxID=557451 RepID=UPI0035B5159D
MRRAARLVAALVAVLLAASMLETLQVSPAFAAGTSACAAATAPASLASAFAAAPAQARAEAAAPFESAPVSAGTRAAAAMAQTSLAPALPAAPARTSLTSAFAAATARTPLASAPAAASATEPTDADRTWQDETIYFIMIDRFHNGDPSNDGPADPRNPRAWHGGDIQGIIDKLDYIQSLGFSAIWITPHVRNAGNDYHGYGAVDFFETDPHFGTNETVKRLVAEAHRRGMKVIFDIVVNHTGPANPLVTEHPDWFHPKRAITNWNDQTQVQEGWLFDLPDFDQSNPEVRQYILDYSRFWIETTDVDGFRLDTVKHVPHEFFTWYAAELQKIKPGFWLIGEDWENAPWRLAAYQDAGVTALLDFPTNAAARSAIAQGGSMRQLANQVKAVGATMPDPYEMGGFLDNHDMTRFVTEARDRPIERLKLGLTFLFTQRAIPILYYGTEIGMEGGNDPYNRNDFPWGEERDHEVVGFVQKLNEIRRSHPALRRGTVEELLATDAHYAYGRAAEDDTVVVVLSNATGPVTGLPVDVTPLGLADGTRLRDELTGREVQVSGGQVALDLDPLSGVILAPVPATPAGPRGIPGWAPAAALGGLAVLAGAVVLVRRARPGRTGS